MTTTPLPPARRWRRTRLALLALAAIALLGAILVHTPFVRGRVLGWIAAEAASRGIRLDASALHYNLLGLSAGLENVALASNETGETFASVERASVDVDWSLTSGLVVERIELARPRLILRRDTDGRWNLPASNGGGGGGFALPVRIGRIVVSDLGVDYADAAASVQVAGAGVSLDLGGDAIGRIAGRVSGAAPIAITWSDGSTEISSFGGDVAFDGAAVHVDGFEAAAPEGRVRANGSVSVAADGALQLDIAGDLDAARLAALFMPNRQAAGRAAFTAAVAGTVDAPDVSFTLNSSDLSSPEIGTVTLDSRGRFASGVVAIDSLTAGIAGGEVQANGRTNLDTRESAADVRWRAIDPRRLAAALPHWAERIGSVTDGTLTFESADGDLRSARARLTAELRPSARSAGAVPLAGTLAMSIENGAWTASANQQAEGAVAIQLDARGALAEPLDTSTLGGAAHVEILDFASAWPLVNAATGSAATAVAPAGLGGRATADLTLSGSLGRPTASGTVRSDNLTVASLPPATLTTFVTASPDALAASELRFASGSNVVTGGVSVAFGPDVLAGDLRAELNDLSTFRGFLPETWQPAAGETHVTLRLGGTLPAPVVDVTATAHSVVVHGETIDTLAAVARLAEGVVTVSSLQFAQGEGRLTGSGSYHLENQQYTAKVTGSGLSVSSPVAARFDLQMNGEGSLDAPRATGFIDFASLDRDGYAIGPARVNVALDGRTLRFDANAPAFGGGAEGAIDLEARTIEATAALTRADIAALARPTGPGAVPDPAEPGTIPAVTGAVDLRATARGPLDDLAAMAVAVDAELTDASINGVPVRLDRPAHFRHEGGLLVADDVALRVGESAVRLNGRLGSTDPADALDIEVTGSLAELASLATIVPSNSRINASGAVDVRLRAAGAATAPVVTGTLSIANGGIAVSGGSASEPGSGDTAPKAFSLENLTVEAALDGGVLNVTTLTGRWQGADINGNASVPLAIAGDRLPASYRATLPATEGPARATLAVKGITAAVLTPFVDESTLRELGGVIDITASFEADSPTVDAVRGDVVLERAELELARVPVRQTVPTRLRLANGRLDVMEWRWESPAGRLGVGGYVRMAGETSELNLGIGGTVDLRMLSAFAPGVAVDGVANVDVRALGTTAEPDIRGGLDVSGANVAMRNPRLAITDLDATATFSRDRVILQRATASANGGTIEMTGDIGFTGATLRDGALTLAGRGLALELVDGLRTEADADLVFSVGDPIHALTGQVTIVRGDYREAIRLTDVLFASRGDAAPPPAPSTEPDFLDRIHLNVAVVSADDVIVRNNYGRLDFGTSLAIIGTAAAPAAAGRVTIREGGQVFLGGQTYAVTRGIVDFTNPARIEPMFDLALETRVQRNDITLELQGTPETLEVNVRSPGISQEDAVSLLLTGQMSDQPGAAYTQVARGQLLMLLSGEVLGIAGRAVGFDTVQVGRGLGGAASTFDLLATESDPSARLTLSKNLRRDVELIISQSLRDTGDITWIAAYRPTRRLEFRAATDDAANESYEFRHEVPFAGGPSGPAAAAPTAAPPQPRVSTVEIGEVPGIAPRDIQRQLRLSAGDRFDVYRWQDGRDRLLAWLHDRGFYEARVAARRRQEGADAVALVYEIDRGPRTNLRVEGHPLDGDTLRRMRAAWTEAVFDGFLIEDLSELARGALVRQGYLGAEVNVSIHGEEQDEKVAEVRIAPGPRYVSRAFAFRGNTSVPAADLEAAIAARGLTDIAWLNRDTFADGLEAHYRSLGFLNAEVTPEAPAFDGDSATLPVTIAEGPLFRISAVEIAGASERPVDEVRALSGLTAGDAYLPTTIEPARRRIETAYLDAGYNQVRVSAAVSTVPDDDVVRVAFEVVEGPQDVLERVDVTGGDHTAETTIARAIDLEPGAPLPLANLYAVQKRLYDLNVFQSVEVGLQAAGGEEAAAQTTGKRPVRAAISLQEMARYRLRYGFRVVDESRPASELFGDESGLRPGFVVDLLNRNVLGRAVTAGIAGQIETDRWLGRGILSLPFMFDLPVVTNVFLTRSRQDLPTGGSTRRFVEDSTALTLEQRFRPSTRMSVTYGYTFSRNHNFEFDPPPNEIPFDITVDVARLTGTYAWDTRDDPSNTSRGWFHSSAIEYGPEPLGSDLSFVRYLGQQYYFHGVGSRVVLASSLRIGAARAFGDQDLLESERFFVGGGTSVRGFIEEGVGPVDFFGDPDGGAAMIVFNQEARVRLHRWITAVGFVDAGNVFPTAGDISFLDLEAGAGGGVRITSPFAILRLDVGVPLSSRTAQKKARWYFGIGQTF